MKEVGRILHTLIHMLLSLQGMLKGLLPLPCYILVTLPVTPLFHPCYILVMPVLHPRSNFALHAYSVSWQHAQACLMLGIEEKVIGEVVIGRYQNVLHAAKLAGVKRVQSSLLCTQSTTASFVTSRTLWK